MGKRQKGNENKHRNNPGSRVARNAKGPRKNRQRWYRSSMVWIIIVLIVAILAGGAVGVYKLSANSSDEAADDMNVTVATTTQAPPMTETERIVSEMTVEEKVGQMMMVGFEGADAQGAAALVDTLHIGGLVLFARNIDTNEQVTQMNATLQQLAFDAGHPVGLLIAVDQEGGKTRRFTDIGPYYSEPMIGEMPEDAAEQTARLQASSAARDLKRIGINTNLAPVLDVSGGWGSVMDVRSFSDDTDLVTRLGAEAVKGYVGASTICAPKHFPGLGSAEGDPEEEMARLEMSAEDITTYELPPFAAAIEAGAPMIMVTHMVVPALDATEAPATISGPIMKELLRSQMGFAGVIITDDLEMGSITGTMSVSEAAVQAVAAGADIVMVAHTLEEQQAVHAALVAAIESGQLDGAEIDAAVGRILEMKQQHRIVKPSA